MGQSQLTEFSFDMMLPAGTILKFSIQWIVNLSQNHTTLQTTWKSLLYKHAEICCITNTINYEDYINTIYASVFLLLGMLEVVLVHPQQQASQGQ